MTQDKNRATKWKKKKRVESNLLEGSVQQRENRRAYSTLAELSVWEKRERSEMFCKVIA